MGASGSIPLHTRITMNHEAVNMKTVKAVAKPVKPRITIEIGGLTPLEGSPGLFSIEVDELPRMLDTLVIVESLQDQKLEPRLIDEALDAVYAVFHKDMVTKILAKRVRYCGPT